ncbi:MAG: hypothetical protein WCG20_01710 [bacterium]
MNKDSVKKILEEPIVLPRNPIWEIVRVFGRDEIIALIIGTVGTALVSLFVSNLIMLALAAPVIEKIGFFIAYIKEPSGLKKGFASMLKDLIAHDPLYALLMVIALSLYNAPAWILSISCFIIALGIVATGEVLITEIRYRLQFLKYKKLGFRFESYLESRFYIKKADTEKIITDFAREFNLHKRESANYHDLYFATKLENFNGREPVLRLRQRTLNTVQTFQIVYTKASEMTRSHPTQFNYYPSRKDKAWIKLDQPMPWSISDIENESIRNLGRSISLEPTREIFFSRSVVRNPQTILVSVDQIENGNDPLTVIEIKSRLDTASKKVFIQAMRHVMLKHEVIQTTHGKSALL